MEIPSLNNFFQLACSKAQQEVDTVQHYGKAIHCVCVCVCVCAFACLCTRAWVLCRRYLIRSSNADEQGTQNRKRMRRIKQDQKHKDEEGWKKNIIKGREIQGREEMKWHEGY